MISKVVESIAFPKEPFSLDNPASSLDKFKSEVLVNWRELCSNQVEPILSRIVLASQLTDSDPHQHQSGGSQVIIFRPNGVIPPHATFDHVQCCYPDVEITVVKPPVLPLSNRGTTRLEDETFVASITTFCATRLHLLQTFLKQGKMGQFYDQLMCLCLYFAAVSTGDGNVSPLRFETTPEDWSAFANDNNVYDGESMFGGSGRWRAWDFLREHELDFEGWFQNAAERWCPYDPRDQATLIAACRAMQRPLYRLYEPIPVSTAVFSQFRNFVVSLTFSRMSASLTLQHELRKSIRNSPEAQIVFARLRTSPSRPSIAAPLNHPLPSKPPKPQFIPVIRTESKRRPYRRRGRK